MSTSKTVLISQASTVVNERYMGEEALPGSIVFENSLSKFMKQATAGAAVQVLVLLEDELQGKGIATAVAASAVARAAVLRSGDRFVGRLVAAYTGKVGDYLAVGTGGQVKAVESTNTPLFKAREAVTVGATANDLIELEVL